MPEYLIVLHTHKTLLDIFAFIAVVVAAACYLSVCKPCYDNNVRCLRVWVPVCACV